MFPQHFILTSTMAFTTLEVLCLLPLDWELCSADTRAYPPLYPQYLACSVVLANE